MQDLKYAVRTLFQNPVLSLSRFWRWPRDRGEQRHVQLVNAVILKPLNSDDSERVTIVCEKCAEVELRYLLHRAGEFRRLGRSSEVVRHHGRIPSNQFTLTGFETAERIPSALVSADYFKLVQTPAFFGRTLLPEDAV